MHLFPLILTSVFAAAATAAAVPPNETTIDPCASFAAAESVARTQREATRKAYIANPNMANYEAMETATEVYTVAKQVRVVCSVLCIERQC
jgi:hypothetical protein